MSEHKGTVMLVAFYNVKALGVRYLETALEKQGYDVVTVFYKNFNSVRPKPTTEAELDLLEQLVAEKKPLFVGLSVMSSMYLDTVHAILDRLQAKFSIPLVCGGAFATMYPQYFLDRKVDYVIRSDGEHAMCRLADALASGGDCTAIPSLCYHKADGPVINEIGDICKNIDEYGLPAIRCRDAYYIENDAIKPGDPQLSTLSYEVIASRGCPFTCSYCCCVNLHRLMPKGTPVVRTRSVQSVIEELKIAKRELKDLVFVHFYDEIFPNLPGWVDEFVVEYQKHIHLPFTIWSHPKMVDEATLKKLVSVGLCEVIMGIQSGSVRIRQDVFHRYETQEDIIRATQTIRNAGVFWASYDFMLQHPFETIDDLKETYKIVTKFAAPYELQLHGLNFLPGTDIIPLAIQEGFVTEQEMQDIMFAPMEQQFGTYWKIENDLESQLWYRLIYCLQFGSLRKKAEKLAEAPEQHQQEIESCYRRALKLAKARYLYKKGRIVLKRLTMKKAS